MSNRKRLSSDKPNNGSIKQFFSSKLKTPAAALNPETASANSSTSSDCGLLNDRSAAENVQDQEQSTLPFASSTTVPAAPSNKIFQSWIKLKGFDDALRMNVFTLHADGGIICLLCSKHPIAITGRGKFADVYTSVPARPQRPSRLDTHLCSEQHQQAVKLEQNQRASLFHAKCQDRVLNKTKTVAERVHLIYWVLKEEVANRKVASLQTLVDRIGHNDRLHDLRHTSSTAVTEFILLISDHLTDRIVADVKQSLCWATMVDETTDIATLQQYITFVQYVNKKGRQATAFLDIHRIDARGATAANLFRLWNEVAADYGLDVGKHVAIACDGAAAMIGRRNSLSQKVTAQNPITYTVHCHAHRLALACTDTVKGLQLIQDCERGLVQTWKYFSISPLKTAKLQEMQTTDVDSSARKLVKACRTRWLSHGEAVIAMKAQLPAVHATLQYFATEKKDCTAAGILHLICSKRFLFSLYLLNAALVHLNKLSLLFQKGSFNFSHMQSALSICKKEMRSIANSDQVLNSLKLDWEKISKILPRSQNALLEDDVKLLRFTTETYCDALLCNLEERFPEPEVLFAFRIFDAKEIPLDAPQRQLYGNDDLQLLIRRFDIVPAEQTLKVVNDYQTLKDRMTMSEFEFCQDPGDVCSKIARDNVFQQMFPELHRLCCIALSIPLATAWPERGFSTLCRVKTKQRNRLLDITLNALINISMNGPEQLTDEDAQKIAEKWQKTKDRRTVTVRALKALESANSANNEEMEAGGWERDCESVLLHEIEPEKFVL